MNASYRSPKGLTLIECLVAMLIFSLIAIAYLHTQQQSLAHYTRLQQYHQQHAPSNDLVHLLTDDLLNLNPPQHTHWQPSESKTDENAPHHPPTTHPSALQLDTQRLILHRSAWPGAVFETPNGNPQNKAAPYSPVNLGARDVYYTLHNDCLMRYATQNDPQLSTETTHHTTAPADKTPLSLHISQKGVCWLPHVTQLKLAVLDDHGQWHDTWPDQHTSNTHATALRITLHTAQQHWERTLPIALHQSFADRETP